MSNKSVSDFVAASMDAVLKSEEHKSLFGTQYKFAQANTLPPLVGPETGPSVGPHEPTGYKAPVPEKPKGYYRQDGTFVPGPVQEGDKLLASDDNDAKDSSGSSDSSDSSSSSDSCSADDDLETSAAFDVAIDSLLTASAALDSVGMSKSSAFSLKLASLVVEAKKAEKKDSKESKADKAKRFKEMLAKKKEKAKAKKDSQSAKDKMAKEKAKAKADKEKAKAKADKEKAKASAKKKATAYYNHLMRKFADNNPLNDQAVNMAIYKLKEACKAVFNTPNIPVEAKNSYNNFSNLSNADTIKYLSSIMNDSADGMKNWPVYSPENLAFKACNAAASELQRLVSLEF